MLADNRLTRITGLIRGVGILVVFLIALAGMPQSGAGESGCQTYLVKECVSWDYCEPLMEDPCGDELPGCGGAGWLACGPTSHCSYPEDLALVCYFESQH